ncbi:hypothetical protein [Marinobacter sp. KMM 10035]|uniref:hypothetical protein n=1 Tax=Marinobacter sp. KMM 10035 TaxID=3134034 RepID=UPI00397AE5B0
MFTRQQVRDHLRTPKAVRSVLFKPASASRNMPKFLQLKGRRIHHTDILDAGGSYRALFLWRDGNIFEKRKFSAWLFLSEGDDLTPIARMDYHPSHKGFHMHVNCEDSRDLTNRALPGAKELAIGRTRKWDPKVDIDRINLVDQALKCLRISMLSLEGGLF